mgnify:FL=1
MNALRQPGKKWYATAITNENSDGTVTLEVGAVQGRRHALTDFSVFTTSIEPDGDGSGDEPANPIVTITVKDGDDIVWQGFLGHGEHIVCALNTPIIGTASQALAIVAEDVLTVCSINACGVTIKH